MVFADVTRKKVDAPAANTSRRLQQGVLGRVGEGVQVALAEHVALPQDARRNADRVDGRVELGVRRGHEHLVQPAAPGVGVVGLGEIHDQRELVHELKRLRPSAVGLEAAELVHHPPRDALGDPHVRVDDPYYVPSGFAVGAGHVPDLGVGAEVVGLPVRAVEEGVFLLDQDVGVEAGERVHEALQMGVGGVGGRGDAEVDCCLVLGVGLSEGGG